MLDFNQSVFFYSKPDENLLLSFDGDKMSYTSRRGYGALLPWQFGTTSTNYNQQKRYPCFEAGHIDFRTVEHNTTITRMGLMIDIIIATYYEDNDYLNIANIYVTEQSGARHLVGQVSSEHGKFATTKPAIEKIIYRFYSQNLQYNEDSLLLLLARKNSSTLYTLGIRYDYSSQNFKFEQIAVTSDTTDPTGYIYSIIETVDNSKDVEKFEKSIGIAGSKFVSL